MCELRLILRLILNGKNNFNHKNNFNRKNNLNRHWRMLLCRWISDFSGIEIFPATFSTSNNSRGDSHALIGFHGFVDVRTAESRKP